MSNSNPPSFPASELIGPSSSPAPAPKYRLYSINSITVATFLGSVVAGAILLGINERRLGRPNRFWPTVLISIAFAALLVWSTFVLPLPGANGGIALGSVVGLRTFAKRTLEDRIYEHQRLGGLMASMWKATGLGFLVLVLIFGVGFIAGIATSPWLGKPFKFSPNEEVYYAGTATEADAKLAAACLKARGYFSGDGAATVAVSRTDKELFVSFIVNDKYEITPKNELAFRLTGIAISQQLKAMPVTIRLLSPTLEVRKEFVVK